MNDLLDRFRPVLNAGGEGGGGQGAGGGQGDGGAGDGGQGWTPPEGLPQDYRGASAEESLGKLLGGFNDLNTRFSGMRDKLAGMPKVPDAPTGYTFEPSDKTKGYFRDLDGNPMFDLARKVAHTAGLSQDGFSKFIEGFYAEGAEAGLIASPYDPAREVASYQSHLGVDRTQATARLDANLAFANGLSEQMLQKVNAPDAVKAEMKANLLMLTDTAAGNLLLDQLQARFGDLGIRVGGEGMAQGELTAEDLKRLDADPRIDPRNRDHPDPAKRFDEDLRKRYDAAYDRHYGRAMV